MVELRQLRQFVAVAEAASFRKAAQRLNMSQPPLSYAIKRLEEELGTRLLDRNQRHVRLTPVGEVFLREARRTLAQADHAVQLAQQAERGLSGSLRITFVASAALGQLPDLMRVFRESHPQAVVQYDSDSTGNQLEALRQGRSDVALIVPPLHDRAGLTLQPFLRETMHLVLPATHPLAARPVIPIEDLAEEAFITFPFAQGPGFESVFLGACARAGFSPRITHEVAQMMTKIMLVAMGAGVALVPGSFTGVPMKNVVYRPLHDGAAAMAFTPAFATPLHADNPLTARFLDCARDFAERAQRQA